MLHPGLASHPQHNLAMAQMKACGPIFAFELEGGRAQAHGLLNALALIDISRFTTMHNLGTGNAGPSVTLELSTQFVGGGDPARPMDAVTEIVRETGKLVFVRGMVEQEGDIVASFSGIVRKMQPRG